MDPKEILLRKLFNCKVLCNRSQLDIESDFGGDIDKYPDDKLHDFLFLGFLYTFLQRLFDVVWEQFSNDLPEYL